MFRFYDLWRIDWYTFMTAAQLWLRGDNPYGAPLGTFGPNAAPFPPFLAYPPTALTWMSLFTPLGAASYFVWTGLELLGWWLLVRDRARSQLVLLAWAPMLLHMVIGQCTLAIVLVLWAAYRAPQRGFWWGVALAFALTKPQIAILPLAYLLWHDRQSPQLWPLLGGLCAGTLALALPPTLQNPDIWKWWLASLTTPHRGILHMAAWQGWGTIPLFLAAYLWHRRHRPNQANRSTLGAGWMWWLSAAIFPQGSYYGVVPVLPILQPSRNYWSIAGFAISAFVQGPATPVSLPLVLALHMLAVWFIAGGPQQEEGEKGVRRKETLSSQSSQVL